MQREPSTELRAAQALAWPGFILDLQRGDLLDAAGQPVELRAQALKLLLILGERAGEVVGKDELMRRVWGDVVVTEDSLVQAIGDIRRTIGDETHTRVVTAPRRGYRLVAEPVSTATGAAAPAGWPPLLPPPPADRARTGGLWSWPTAAGVLLLLVAVATVGWRAAADASAEAPPRSLAILPFESEDGTDAWFVDGVASDLGAIVATWPGATVVGRGTMAAYKGRAVDPRRVGAELGVRHVLTGRARRDGDDVRLAVSLVDTRSGRVVWSELRDVRRAELAALVGDVAGGIARTLVVEYGDAVAADASALAPNGVQADDLAMQGMAELLRTVSRAGWERAAGLFDAALAIDPDCVRCLAGASLTHSNLVLWEWTADRPASVARAEQALARLDALAADRLLAKLSHASLANVHRDWPGLLAIGDQLVAQFPNEPTSHHHRCSALVRLGRFDDSLAACDRAMRISPRDSRLTVWQGLSGWAHYLAGRPAAAEAMLRPSVLANPRVPFYGVVLAAAVAEQGRRGEATAVLQQTRARHPGYSLATIRGYWVAGDPRFVAGRDRLLQVAAVLGLPA
ncbi:MAG: winged helix-turn-helix domain-containing protein [Rubrivivax sp.]